MAQCRHCDRPVKETANFCSYCGTALRAAPSGPTSQPAPPSSMSESTPPDPADSPVRLVAPRKVWVGGTPPTPTGQPPTAAPSQFSGQPFDIQPGTRPSTTANQKQKLFLFALLFAAAGLLLIFVIAPEFTSFRRLIFSYGVQEYEPEYWMAMVGGGVSLLLGGAFLLKALTLPDEKS